MGLEQLQTTTLFFIRSGPALDFKSFLERHVTTHP